MNLACPTSGFDVCHLASADNRGHTGIGMKLARATARDNSHGSSPRPFGVTSVHVANAEVFLFAKRC